MTREQLAELRRDLADGDCVIWRREIAEELLDIAEDHVEGSAMADGAFESELAVARAGLPRGP